ncbi:CBS domain-containing protein [Paraburkholderia phymatum]|uniref:Putative signal-transduction protein with CBS domains n=1 Tax=Paraburkholderia phymatum (strain DSM 17167 / CIP 108236 / LMG 21445 / STM815) TaxID=391038 RepID=B2JVB0_PARP8|nr:CBS domain-containing protein [Paraburkholderia phymatum]ACC74887.1 putative signal-transduction protein with CBS domains [Paraburkholderia phymatum STM815]
MLAIDVMTPSVICAQPDMTVQEAAKRLVDNRISGMPVVDASGGLVGMVSEGDLLHRVETGTETRRSRWLEVFSTTRDLASTFVKEHGRSVADVMTASVLTVDWQMPVADIADLMERRRIKRVPVMRGGKLIGIVTRGNLIRALASAGAPARPQDGQVVSDREIAEAIVAALRDKRWALTKENVIVKDGVAHLWGVIQSEEEERALCVAALEVKGVKEARAHLSYPTVMPLM